MPVENSKSEAGADAFRARQLLRSAVVATLATLDQATGAPYASLVQVATEPDGTPVLLISQLARHTRNLTADSRASLLIDCRDGAADPLAAHRVTLMGRARPLATPFGRSRFLRRHPSARQFADFADFRFWSLQVELAHSIAGFGRIREISGADIVIGPATSHAIAATRLAQAEEALLTRLNQGNVIPTHSELTGFDCEGFDVRVDGAMRREFLAGAIDNPDTAERLIHRHFASA